MISEIISKNLRFTQSSILTNGFQDRMGSQGRRCGEELAGNSTTENNYGWANPSFTKNENIREHTLQDRLQRASALTINSNPVSVLNPLFLYQTAKDLQFFEPFHFTLEDLIGVAGSTHIMTPCARMADGHRGCDASTLLRSARLDGGPLPFHRAV